MSVKGNSSNEQVVKESTLYTGLAIMRVVGINPNKAELEALGYKPQAEPVYLSKDGDLEKVRIDFYLQHPTLPIRTKAAFFLENKVRVDQNGSKCEWINNFSRTAWGSLDVAPEQKWFDPKTARQAKVGESDLYSFIVNWLNIAPTDEAKLDKFDMLFKGDFSELKQLFRSFPTNELRVLLTVREGKYQSVYRGYFDRATNKRNTYWESFLKKKAEDGYGPKEDYQNSLTFLEWKEPFVMAEASPVTSDTGKTDKDPF